MKRMLLTKVGIVNAFCLARFPPIYLCAAPHLKYATQNKAFSLQKKFLPLGKDLARFEKYFS